MNIFRWKFLIICFVPIIIGVVAGCDNDDDDDDDSHNPMIGTIHLASDMGTITFLMDESAVSHLEFGDGVTGDVSADQYDIHFETALPGDDIDICNGDSDDDDIKDDDECTRFNEGAINVVKDQEYMLVLYGRYNDLEILEYEKSYHEFDIEDEDEDGDPEDENMEVQFFHMTEALGEVDVFLEPPGTNLSPTQAIGTLSLKGEFNTLVDEDDYVLTLTAVGDPSTVYFTSDTISLDKQTKVAFVIRDGADDGASDIKVQFFRDQSGTLIDRNADTEIRVMHTVAGGDNVDIYVDNDFAAPFFANLAYGQASVFNTIRPGSLTDVQTDVTPAGNPGVFLAREDLGFTKGTKNTFYLIGEADDWDGIVSEEYLRRLAMHARLKLVNGASSTELDFYIKEPNSNITTLSPTSSVAFRLNSGWMRFNPGIYEIVLTNYATDTIVYGPRTIELSAGGLYTVVATSNLSDPTAVGILLLDDFEN